MPVMTSSFFIPLALSFAVAMATSALIRLAWGAVHGRALAGMGISLGTVAGWIAIRGISLSPSSLADMAVLGMLAALIVGGVLEKSALRMRWVSWPLGGYALLSLWIAMGRPGEGAAPGVWVGAGLLMIGWALVLGRLHQVAKREAAEAWVLVASVGLGLALLAWAAGTRGQVMPSLALGFAAVGSASVALPFRLPFGVSALVGSGGAVMWIVQALAIPRPTLTIPLVVLLLGLFAGATGRRLPMGARMGPLWSAVLALAPAVLAALIASSLPF